MRIQTLETAVVLFIISVSILSLIPMPVSYALTVVKGALSAGDVLIVVDNTGKIKGMYPTGFYIEHLYTYTYGTNETGVVEYRVVNYGWWWSYPGEPPTRLEVPDIGLALRLKYDAKFNIYSDKTVKTENNVTTSFAAIVIELDVKTYIEFEKAPNVTGSINIGEYLRKYLFGDRDPSISYYVSALKYVDGQPVGYVHFGDDVVLSLSDLVANVHTLSLYVNKIVRKGYNSTGDLDSVALISPLYDIEVCGNVYGSSKKYTLIVSYLDKEAVLTVPGCRSIENVAITPGANSTIPVVVRSGAFTMQLNYNMSIEGAYIAISRASGRAVGSPGKWNFVVTAPVTVSGYLGSSCRFTVTGTVSGGVGVIPCQTLSLNNTGIYTLLCNATIGFGGTTTDISSDTYTISVTVVDEFGRQHSFKGSVYIDAIDPTNIADVAWQIYDIASRVLFMGAITVTVLMLISILLGTFMEHPPIDPSYLRGALLTILVAAVIVTLAIPYTYRMFTEILASIPTFQQYVSVPPSSDPKTVFTHMIGYYDKLFQAIESDYQTRFVANVQGIMSAAGFMVGIFLAMTLIALAVSFLAGASIPFASIASVAMSTLFTYLSMALFYAPAGAAIIVAVVIGRLVVLLTTAVVIAVMTVGIFLIAIPTPLSQRLGEEMFGAGVLYFITFPLLGPISYSLYRYVIDTASRSISQTPISLPLGIVSIFVPVQQIINIMIYIIASGTVLMMVLLTLGYILQRTGVAVGLGEALSGLMWRG